MMMNAAEIDQQGLSSHRKKRKTDRMPRTRLVPKGFYFLLILWVVMIR